MGEYQQVFMMAGERLTVKDVAMRITLRSERAPERSEARGCRVSRPAFNGLLTNSGYLRIPNRPHGILTHPRRTSMWPDCRSGRTPNDRFARGGELLSHSGKGRFNA
jgi:hypothetical protein